MLSKNAFNALLKTLEEPPSHVKFIFATTEIRKVPITVLSRCQRFDLQRLSVEDLLKLFNKIILAEKLEAQEEALKIIAKAADGSARDALSLLDQAISLGAGFVKTDIVKNMIGLADRNQTFELFENLMVGDVQKVVSTLQDQYKNGANPTTLLQDLVNITHMIAKAKIIPASVNDSAMSESERNLCEKLSATTPIAILSKVWQMLIKGLNEMQVAPIQIDALEMILIRIAYSANLPTPYEILNDVKKNSNLSQNTVITVAQPSVSVVKHVEIPVLKKMDSKQVFNTADEMIAYFEENKKMLLSYALKNDVAIESFEDGIIKMTISDKINPDFLMNLYKVLEEATGKAWKIETLRGSLGQTIAGKEHEVQEENKRNISEYPLVKAILAEFKGAKIETLTHKILEDNDELKIGNEEPEIIFDDDNKEEN